MNRRQVKFYPSEVEYLRAMADREYGGNMSEAVRFCVSLSRSLDHITERLEAAEAVKEVRQ